MQLIALGRDGAGQNLFSKPIKAKTVSKKDGGEEVGRQCRKKFLMENRLERPEALELVVICTTEELGIGLLCEIRISPTSISSAPRSARCCGFFLSTTAGF